MYRALSDLRIVRLALHLEDTLEAYEESLRDRLREVPVRAHLAPLFEEGPGHQQLKDAVREVGVRASSTEDRLEPQDILQTMADCERLAHDFYLSQLDRLSDPALVQLFKELAAEEREHLARVLEAMEILRALRAKTHTSTRGI